MSARASEAPARGIRAYGGLEQLASTILTGVVIGITEIALAASFASLIFSGPLSSHLPAGIGLALFGAVVVVAILAVGSSLIGAVGTVQDSTTAIVALMAASIAARFPAGAEEAFVSVVLLLGLSTIAAGAFFLLLGACRLGDLIRFVPHPVMGGFLAGTGWLLLKGGIGVLADMPLTFGNLSKLFVGDTLVKWLPGIAFAVAVWLLVRRSKRPLIIPMAVLAATVVFYASLAIGGWGVHDAQVNGWVLGPFPSGDLWKPLTWSALSGADWSAVISQATTLPSLLVIGAIQMLLCVSGLELAVRRDVDVNRELRVAGAANLVSGLGGGIIGFHALSLTLLAHRSGARSRLVGLVTAATCAVALLFGASVVALMPRPLLGGILVLLGLGLLVEWLYDARSQLPLAEYMIVVLILVVIAALGFLPGVSVGIVAAVILFVVNYSRTDVVKHALSGRTYQSRVDRSARQVEFLREHGDEIYVLELHGYVFFGTAHGLFKRISLRARDPDLPALRFLVLDFRRASGLDSSAAMSFEKAHQLAANDGFTLVFTGVSDGLRRVFTENGLSEDAALHFAPDLDRGVQWCEDRLLVSEGLADDAEPDMVRRQLTGWLPLEASLERLLPYIERLEIPSHHWLLRQGDPSDELYFLETGRLTATLATADPDGMRLRTMGPGAVVGELGMYLGTARTASIVSETPSTLYRLTRHDMERLEADDPKLAAALHRLFARLLAARLADTLRSVDALSR